MKLTWQAHSLLGELVGMGKTSTSWQCQCLPKTKVHTMPVSTDPFAKLAVMLASVMKSRQKKRPGLLPDCDRDEVIKEQGGLTADTLWTWGRRWYCGHLSMSLLPSDSSFSVHVSATHSFSPPLDHAVPSALNSFSSCPPSFVVLYFYPFLGPRWVATHSEKSWRISEIWVRHLSDGRKPHFDLVTSTVIHIQWSASCEAGVGKSFL